MKTLKKKSELNHTVYGTGILSSEWKTGNVFCWGIKLIIFPQEEKRYKFYPN